MKCRYLSSKFKLQPKARLLSPQIKIQHGLQNNENRGPKRNDQNFGDFQKLFEKKKICKKFKKKMANERNQTDNHIKAFHLCKKSCTLLSNFEYFTFLLEIVR